MSINDYHNYIFNSSVYIHTYNKGNANKCP